MRYEIAHEQVLTNMVLTLALFNFQNLNLKNARPLILQVLAKFGHQKNDGSNLNVKGFVSVLLIFGFF